MVSLLFEGYFTYMPNGTGLTSEHVSTIEFSQEHGNEEAILFPFVSASPPQYIASNTMIVFNKRTMRNAHISVFEISVLSMHTPVGAYNARHTCTVPQVLSLQY